MKPLIIDFHTHVFPPKIAAHALATLEDKAVTVSFTDGTAAALRESMKEAGVDKSVLLSIATNPLKVSHMNDLQIAASRQGEKDFIYFGCIHPHCPTWQEELQKVADAGLKGVKIHPQYQGVPIDDPRFVRILSKCGELGLIVVNHSGKEPAYPGLFYSNPQTIRKVLLDVGPVTFVGAHMGGMQCWEEVADTYGDLKHVYLDTSFSLRHLKPSEQGYYTQEIMAPMQPEDFAAVVRAIGADRVLFGTDSPWRSQKASIGGIQELPLTEEEKELIFHKNAEKLLNV